MNPLRVKYNEWDVIFVFIYVLFSSKILISATTIEQSYSDFMKYLYTFLFFCIMGVSALKIKKTELLFFGIIGFICLITFFLSKSAAIYATLVVIFISFIVKRIDYRKVSFLCLVGNFIIAGMIVPFLFSSDIQSTFDYRYGLRDTFGFYNPNYAGIILLFIYISVCWFLGDFLSNSLICFILYTILLPVIFIAIEKTISRTSELLLVIYYLMIVCSLLTKKIKVRRLSSIVFFIAFVLIITFQFYTAINYTPVLMSDLNSSFAGRLSLSNYLYQGVGLPNIFYGTNIEQYQPIDFFFIELVYTNGWFVSIWITYLYFKCLMRINISISEMAVIMACIATALTQKVILIPCCAYLIYIVFSKREDI